MSEIEQDEAEIAKIMSNLPELAWLAEAEPSIIRHEINTKIAKILNEYYLENTRGGGTGWTYKFKKAGITEDDGKAAISCARRLGINIS